MFDRFAGGLVAIFFLATTLGPKPLLGASCTVPVDAGCATIQTALNQASGGDTINVQPGIYSEKVSFPSSGSLATGFITLAGAPGHASILDGSGVTGANMVLIDSRSYVKVTGFEIRDNIGVNDGSGVRIQGSGSHIEIRNNKIHDIRGLHAMGITVYGTDAASISDLIIDGNEIYDCEPATSEALTLNGNVERFEVTNNLVRDVNNIGIDFIGGETDIQPDPDKVVRDGVCRGNQVYRARSSYGGGFAGAIYVDGGRDIVIERNITSESDLGLEIGAENSGTVTRGIIVRDNIIYRNDKVGIVFGGFDASVGRVEDCSFTHNTLFENDTLGEGLGELWIQFASNNVIRNNIFVAGGETLLYSENGNINNQLDYNLWFGSSPTPTFVWSGTGHAGLASFQTGSGQETNGLYADPLLSSPATIDFRLLAGSPAVDAGDPAFVAGVGETDFEGAPRVSGLRVDIGADETNCGDSNLDVGEACDDGNQTDCDGCDSNCSLSSDCGNGVLCGLEVCDDGNTTSGDCCSATCQWEAPGTACDDGDLCTNVDLCDGSGGCTGMPAPAAPCLSPLAPGRSKLQLHDHHPSDRDKLSWKWGKGAETLLADFGDPTQTTDYVLCIYDSSPASQPRVRTAVSPSSGWRGSSRGFRYKDSGGVEDGVRTLTLKSGAAGKSSVSLSGRGDGLSLPALGLTTPVTAQLRNELGACWGASFTAPTKNDLTDFKAKGQ